MRLHSPDRGVYSTATAQQHEKGRVYFQLVESAGLVKYVYCLYTVFLICINSLLTPFICLQCARAQLINLIIFLTQTFPETDYKFHFVHLFYLHCGALIFFCSLNYYLSYLLDFISIHTKYRILFISFNSFCTVYNSRLI